MQPKNLRGVKEEGHYKAKNGDGDFVDPAFAIFPIMKTNKNGIVSLVGTGFFISNNGLFLTAKHVLMDVFDPQTDEQTASIFLFQNHRNNTYTIRPILRCVSHNVADISVGVAAPLTNKDGEPVKNNFLCLSSKINNENSKVFTYAYPRTVTESSPDDHKIYLYADFYEGVLQTIYPNGRDSVLMPGSCCQTSMYIHGGASGGPVFNEHGTVFAVNSTGFDDDSLSFITPINVINNLLLHGVQTPNNMSGQIRIQELIDDKYIIYD